MTMKTMLQHADNGKVALLDMTQPEFCKIPATASLMRIDYDLLHYAIFQYNFKSLNLNLGNRIRINYNKNICLEVVNPSADFNDAVNLLSIVKMVQDKLTTGKGIEITHDSMGHCYVIKTSDRELLRYCGKGNNDKSKADLHESIKHLKEISVHFEVFNDQVECPNQEQTEAGVAIKTKSGKLMYARSFGFIDDYETSKKKGRGNNCMLRINGLFLDICLTKKHSLTVRHSELHGLSQAEQGIMLYLAGQERNYIPIRRLQKYFRIIQPPYPAKATKIQHEIWQSMMVQYQEQIYTFKKRIKEALASLKTREIIKSYNLCFSNVEDKSTLKGFLINRSDSDQ